MVQRLYIGCGDSSFHKFWHPLPASSSVRDLLKTGRQFVTHKFSQFITTKMFENWIFKVCLRLWKLESAGSQMSWTWASEIVQQLIRGDQRGLPCKLFQFRTRWDEHLPVKRMFTLGLKKSKHLKKRSELSVSWIFTWTSASFTWVLQILQRESESGMVEGGSKLAVAAAWEVVRGAGLGSSSATPGSWLTSHPANSHLS